MRKENSELKERLNDLKTSYAIIQVENEELEDKTESLDRYIICLEDKLEEAYLQTRNTKEAVNKITLENKILLELYQTKKILKKRFSS